MNPTDQTTNPATAAPAQTPAASPTPAVPGVPVVTPAAPQAVAGTPPVVGANVQSSSSNNSKKMMMVAGAVLLVLLLVIGGVIFFLTVSPSPQSVSTPPEGQAAGQESPEQLLQEVEAVDLGDVETDFKDVDSDLNSL